MNYYNKIIIGSYIESSPIYYREIHYNILELNKYVVDYIKCHNNETNNIIYSTFIDSNFAIFLQKLKYNIITTTNNFYIKSLKYRIDEKIYYITYNV